CEYSSGRLHVIQCMSCTCSSGGSCYKRRQRRSSSSVPLIIYVEVVSQECETLRWFVLDRPLHWLRSIRKIQGPTRRTFMSQAPSRRAKSASCSICGGGRVTT